MRLATRCPSCTTMFLVVEDQLRVSEGWVRCGRCANVFNAVDDLIDVEQGTPVQLDIDSLQSGTRLAAATAQRAPGSGAMVPEQALDAPAGEGPGDWSLEPAAQPVGAARATDAWLPPPPAPAWPPDGHADPAPLPAPPAAPHLTGPRTAAPAMPAPAPPPPRARPAPPAVRPSEVSARDEDSALPDQLLRAPSEPFDDDSVPPSSIGVSQGWSTLSPEDPTEPAAARRQAAPSSLPPADNGAPSFVREAERAQRWKRSPVRTALGVAAGLLLVLAGLQTTLLWRDKVAAHVPGLTPLLQAACAPLGCSLQPLRRIDQLAVDSSGLTRVDDGSDPANHRYRLAVLLHNKAATALMAPAIELTLTDVRGEIVARRVLQMADFGQPPAPMAAGQELPLRVLLATGPQRVEGYTVEIFYP